MLAGEHHSRPSAVDGLHLAGRSTGPVLRVSGLLKTEQTPEAQARMPGEWSTASQTDGLGRRRLVTPETVFSTK